jgi:hypothetical protein
VYEGYAYEASFTSKTLRGIRMKRYWKIVVLVPFILLCIGAYYINAASISYPDYYLKLQAGDEKEAAGVSLKANYTNQSLTIRSEGSEYGSNASYWSSLTSRYPKIPELEKLKKEHRQFMRGKNDPGAFYEDDKVLGYVEMDSSFNPAIAKYDYHFNISVYDKEHKRSLSFKLALPGGLDYQTIKINDIQINGQTLNLITMNIKESRNDTKVAYGTFTEFHHYKLDLDKKIMAADQVIISGDSADVDDPIQIRNIPETESFTKSNPYTVFQIDHLKIVQRKDVSGIVETDHQELVYYDLQSAKLVTIQNELIKDLMKKVNQINISYSQDKLMLTYLNDPSAVRVILYNLTENKIESELTIDTKHSLAESETFTFAKSANNRLYLWGNLKYDDLKSVPAMVITDLDTGKILYEGYISRKDNKEISNLMLGNILIE